MKEYNLEERTFSFAKRTRIFCSKIKRNLVNQDDIGQLLRASGSVGANYIEANEALSKKDFIHRVKICRKEAKESHYWFRIIEVIEVQEELEIERKELLQEAKELMNIFGSIVRKLE